MKICTLGTGTGIPRVKRRAPATLFETENHIILFDTGPGTLRALEEAGRSFREIDYIFYTHFHPDHVSDLVPFLFASRSPEYGRLKPVEIWGATGLLDIYEKYKAIFGKWIELPPSQMKIVEIQAGVSSSFQLPFGIIKAFPMYHTPQSLGYRIEIHGNPVFSITGDTDYGDNLLTLARNTEFLVSECSFPDEGKVTGHLTPREAGKMAEESGCKCLILTHLYPECDDVDITGQCRKVFGGEMIIARDLMWIAVEGEPAWLDQTLHSQPRL